MSGIESRRRSFMKWIAAAPVFAAIATQTAAERLSAASSGVMAAGDVYRRIGVRPFINGRGTWTYLSGSLELPEVRVAMDAAARQFVDMFELQKAAGKRLAELSHAESGMVTSGAAGAMAAATAACIAGSDPARIWQLPDTTGLKHEVIMLGGRSAFDNAIRLVGGKLVLVNRVDEMQSALNDKTAMIYTTWRDEQRLAQALAVSRPAKVPLMVDDAAGIPPIENLARLSKIGVDLYCFSGGKGLRGPQCSGILLGRKDLVEAALANCSPWEGSVCRSMKVGKEEIIGILTALETWTKMDLAELNVGWGQKVQRIAKLVETIPGVSTKIEIPQDGNSYPTLTVNWNEAAFGFTVADCDRELRAGEPRIEVLTSNNPSLVSAVHEGDPKAQKRMEGVPRKDRLQIVSMTLQDGEDLIIGKRLREIFLKARKKEHAASPTKA